MSIDTGPLTMDQIDMLRREKLALSSLADKQRAFCEEYCRSFDKLQALKAGGYWTPKSAKAGGSQAALIRKSYDKKIAFISNITNG
ncbi:MAG TPA: hypothetical protein P5056_04070 [Candidatus Paceibacterota bacterium]|nr:hypothetical protein [Candidatus Paceibacterota bacterium]